MLRLIFHTRREFFRVLAALFLGILVGAAGITLLVSRELDRLYLENSDLRMELSSKRERVTQLEESLQEYRHWVIYDLTVDIENGIDEHVKLEIRDRIRSLLNNIIGREIETLDHELVYSIIDGRILEVEERGYHLDLRTLIVGQNMRLILRVSERE